MAAYERVREKGFTATVIDAKDFVKTQGKKASTAVSKKIKSMKGATK